MNEQEKFWIDEYAEKYVSKNSNFNLELGIQAWSQMLSNTANITNFLECGCNIGRNIDFLSHTLPNAKPSVIEIAPDAFKYVTDKYQPSYSFNGTILNSKFTCKFDLVYTMGVLIHVDPENLLNNMRKMYHYSNKYILIGEYFNRTPEQIKYCGKDNLLFKCDFGKIFIENFDVELIDYGFLWGHQYDDAGFDDITWWLFAKRD